MSNINLHTEEFKDFIGMEVKSVKLDIVVNNVEIPPEKRKVSITNYGKFIGVYEKNDHWNIRLELSKNRYRRLELNEFELIEFKLTDVRRTLEKLAGELTFSTNLLEKHGFESICLGNYYCLGKSDLEITLKFLEKYESFKQYRIEFAKDILKRYGY